jgi:hypothetical protein
MNIHTYSQPKAYTYQGNLATYFPDNSNIDSTLKEAMIWMADPKEFKDKSDCQTPISELHNNTSTNPDLSTIEKINNIFIEGIGIRCFTIDDKQVENGTFMWREYADNDAGICLVFNPSLDLKFFSSEDIIGVEYVTEFGQLNLHSKIDYWNEESLEFIKAKCYSFGIKKQKYAEENEIRVIKSVCNTLKLFETRMREMKGASQLEIDMMIEKIVQETSSFLKENKHLRKQSFEKKSLIEIRFGEKMCRENPQRVTEIKDILNSSGYEHVMCKRAVYNSINDSFTYEDF